MDRSSKRLRSKTMRGLKWGGLFLSPCMFIFAFCLLLVHGIHFKTPKWQLSAFKNAGPREGSFTKRSVVGISIMWQIQRWYAGLGTRWRVVLIYNSKRAACPGREGRDGDLLLVFQQEDIFMFNFIVIFWWEERAKIKFLKDLFRLKRLINQILWTWWLDLISLVPWRQSHRWPPELVGGWEERSDEGPATCGHCRHLFSPEDSSLDIFITSSSPNYRKFNI